MSNDMPGFPSFDPAEFLAYVKDENLSDAEARALLTEMWKIILGMARIQFGMHPVQAVLDKSPAREEGATFEATSVVECKEQFSKATTTRIVPRRKRRARSRRDS